VKTLKKLGTILLWGILIPIGVAFLLAALPVLLVEEYFGEKKAKKRLKRLREEKAGTIYLVCSPRRGWFDFIQNNVVPVLPPTIELAWYRVDHRAAADDMTFLLWRCGGYRASKPLVMMVGEDEVRTESLHQALASLKPTVRKDAETQEKCRAIIAEALERLRRESGVEHSTTDGGTLEDSP
jgi:hypothetical protein